MSKSVKVALFLIVVIMVVVGGIFVATRIDIEEVSANISLRSKRKRRNCRAC